MKNSRTVFFWFATLLIFSACEKEIPPTASLPVATANPYTILWKWANGRKATKFYLGTGHTREKLCSGQPTQLNIDLIFNSSPFAPVSILTTDSLNFNTSPYVHKGILDYSNVSFKAYVLDSNTRNVIDEIPVSFQNGMLTIPANNHSLIAITANTRNLTGTDPLRLNAPIPVEYQMPRILASCDHSIPIYDFD